MPDSVTCGCGHLEASHFPACLSTIRSTTNRWGGGSTVLCGCPAFGSPMGATLGRKRLRAILRAIERQLIDVALPKFGPLASAHEAQSVIGEEFHEFTLAVWFGVDQHGEKADPRVEAIQTAAMAVRYLLDIPVELGVPDAR